MLTVEKATQLGLNAPEHEMNSSTGILDENDPLRRVMIWGPPGNAAYLAQLHPENVSLFLDNMDVDGARREFGQFATALEANGVEVLKARDIIAHALPPSPELTRENMLHALINRADRIKNQYPHRPNPDPVIIEYFLDEDISRYGSDAALALNKLLSLSPDLPMGNTLYACDQMKMVGKTRVSARLKYPIRQPEIDVYEIAYNAIGMQNRIVVPDTETFEGGDLYIHNGIVYLGVGARTSWGAALYIADALAPVLKENGLEFAAVVDKDALNRSQKEQMDHMHLDTWSMPIDRANVMLLESEAMRRRVWMLRPKNNADVLAENTNLNYRDFLLRRGETIHPISIKQQQSFGTNNLAIDSQTVIVSLDTNRETHRVLTNAGKTVLPLSMYHSTRGYGAAHCMTAQLWRE